MQLKFDKQISPSMLDDLNSCPFQYYVKHVLKERGKIKTASMIMGSVIHKLVEDYYKDGVVYEPMDFIQSYVVPEYGQEAYGVYKGWQDLNQLAEEDVKGSAKREVKDLQRTKAFIDVWKPRLDTYRLEVVEPLQRSLNERLSIRHDRNLIDSLDGLVKCLTNFYALTEKVGYDEVVTEHMYESLGLQADSMALTKGIIDRIEVVRTKEGGVWNVNVFDYKSGRREKSLNDCANSNQLFMYAEAAREVYGQRPSAIGYWNLYAGKIVAYRPTEEDYERFYRRFSALVRYKGVIDQLLTEGDLTEVEALLPVPAGANYKPVCNNCMLPYEKDERLRCPYFKDVERRN